MDRNFTTLYSKNLDGSIQQWTITVKGNVITKVYGKMHKKMQTVSDTVHNGKNIGKKNETSPSEQAIAEATAQWEKKLKSGYVRTQREALIEKVDRQFVTGGIEPMLAHKFRDHSHKIEYPCFSQPKLDGIRCIALVKNGKCTLWSRTRKQITGVPHIIKAIENQFPNETIFLDGELYNHSYKNKFEEIVSFVRQETPKAGHEVVEYHVYDIVDDSSTFSERSATIVSADLKSPLVCVDTRLHNDESDLRDTFTADRTNGYEGTMARNGNAFYEQRRSYNLQKIKEFEDAEFEIVGVEAGRGRMSECAVFKCRTAKKDEFYCKMEGSLDNLKVFMKNPTKVIGKMLTVRFQGMTNGNVPRFPIGVSVRDYE